MSSNYSNLKLIFQQNEKISVIIITTVFFFFAMYTAIIHHPIFGEEDGIWYLRMGEEILKGNYQNAKIPDAPPIGPMFYALMGQITGDAFLTLKLISVFGSTGIVFVSYYIIKNIFNHKIAIISQLLIATNFKMFYLSYSVLNEVIPLLMIFTSLYYLTKQKITLQNIIIGSLILGMASSFRYQAILIFIGLIFYLLIKNKNVKNNFKQIIVCIIFFSLALSPLMIFNFTNQGNLIDSSPNQHIRWQWEFQTPEWRDSVEQIITSESNDSAIFVDFDLFLKNYLYNFFYNNPNKLFNFGTYDTISIFPMIPMLGLITFSAAYIHIFNFKLSKLNIFLILISLGISLLVINQIGSSDNILFAVFFVPLLVIGAINFKKSKSNLVMLMIISLAFLTIISMSHISRANQLFPIWLIIPAFNAVFFVEILPKILNKLKILKNQTKIISMIIAIVIIANIGASIGFSYLLLYPHEFNGVNNEIQLFLSSESFKPSGTDAKIIGELLSHEENIEDSYIMASAGTYSYYSGSKWISAGFAEGKSGDTIENYINSVNWSEYDLHVSNLNGFPPDVNNIKRPIPDYVIYDKKDDALIEPHRINSTQYLDLKILSDPSNPKIPSNFEIIWKSDDQKIFVYKIHK